MRGLPRMWSSRRRSSVLEEGMKKLCIKVDMRTRTTVCCMADEMAHRRALESFLAHGQPLHGTDRHGSSMRSMGGSASRHHGGMRRSFGIRSSPHPSLRSRGRQAQGPRQQGLQGQTERVHGHRRFSRGSVLSACSMRTRSFLMAMARPSLPPNGCGSARVGRLHCAGGTKDTRPSGRWRPHLPHGHGTCSRLRARLRRA